jgi:hypothetical protein
LYSGLSCQSLSSLAPRFTMVFRREFLWSRRSRRRYLSGPNPRKPDSGLVSPIASREAQVQGGCADSPSRSPSPPCDVRTGHLPGLSHMLGQMAN